MRVDRASIRRAELVIVVHDVEERLMNLPDVVEERDAFDRVALPLIESGCVRNDQRIVRDSPNVLPGLRIVGFDRVQQCLEAGGGKSLEGATRSTLANKERHSNES